MADLFNRQNDAFHGAFAADGAAITFPQVAALAAVAAGPAAVAADGFQGGSGLLTQNLNIQYTQQITKLYELGTPYVYYVGGRSQGQLGMARVLGPRPILVAFYATFGDVCNASINNLDISVNNACDRAGNNPGGALNAGAQGPSIFHTRFCVITSIGITVAAQDMIINEQLQMMFGSLNLDGGLNPKAPVLAQA